MDDSESLSHTTWTCKYHVVFIPKGRRKALYQELRRHLGEVFRKLALQRESRVEEGHLMPDHVHMLLSIPPKYAVSQVVGYIKGKSAIHLARVYAERKRNFVGQHFWAPGILRQHRRPGRGGHPSLHPQPREGGSEARTIEPLALTTPPLGGSKLNGPRQRPALPL
jgi:putative transposase